MAAHESVSSVLARLQREEEEAEQKILHLLQSCKKTIQALDRRQARVERLKTLVRELEELPTIEDSSSGEEKYVKLLHDIRSEKPNTLSCLDSFVLGNDEEAVQVTMATSITMKNVGSLKLSDRPFAVVYNIAGGKVVSRYATCDWGKNLFKVEQEEEPPAQRNVQTVAQVHEARREKEPPAQPNVMQTVAEVHEPPQEEQVMPEIFDQPSTSSGITSGARELPRVTQNIKLRKNCKQLSVVLRRLKNDRIARGEGRPRRGNGPVLYKESSSDENSDDERLRFKSAKTRKFWRRERKRKHSWAGEVSESDHSESTVASRQSRQLRPRR